MSIWWDRVRFNFDPVGVVAGDDTPDIIFAFGGDQTVSSGGGSDFILTGAGNDSVDAGADDDFVFTGAGADTIQGGAGNDYFIGGADVDTVVYIGGIDDYTIENFGILGVRVTAEAGAADAGSDYMLGIEALYFAADDYTLFLDGTNNAVLAGDDEVAASEDGVTQIAVADLLANDRDFDGDEIFISGVDGVSAAGATVTLDGGLLSYDPGAVFDALGEGEVAQDSFSYTVDDGQGGTDTATVTVTVTGVNDAPVLVAVDAVIEENTTAVPINADASDVDGDVVMFSLAGLDADLFAIDAVTGSVAFLAAPDFEAPGDADGDNVYDITVVADDGNGAMASQDVSVTVTDVDEGPSLDARINELHYDNDGSDVGEFVEVRVALGEDVSGLSVEFYNGNGGGIYLTSSLSPTPSGSDDTYAYYVVEVSGIQNGAPDGLALINNGEVLEFLSYEGTFTATSGTAAGLDSTDIGVEEPSTLAIGQSLQRNDDGTWRGPEEETRGFDNDFVPPVFAANINEIHYDNDGGDAGEFVEVRVTVGGDVSSMSIELYNGSNGGLYGSINLPGAPDSSDGSFDYYVVNTPGIQNGAPDGVALVNGGEVLEFLSYEGSFTASGGTANGLTSTDLGVSEASSTPIGQSLQLIDGVWQGPLDETRGTANGAVAAAVVINELAVSTTGADFEFFELFGEAGTSLDGFALIQISGNPGFSGDVTSVIDLTGQSIGADGFFLAASPVAVTTFGIDAADLDLSIPDDTFENFSSSFLLVEGVTGLNEGDDLDTDNDGVLDLMPYAGVVDSIALSSSDSPFIFATAEVGPDGSFLAPGAKRDMDGTGTFVQTDFSDTADYTPGSTNTPPPPTEITLISTIQGDTGSSGFVGQQVTVSAVVTQILDGRGFFLQEEETDYDGNALTSEGIFVFTGGGVAVTLGDLVEVSGSVSEFNGETQIGGTVSATVIAQNVTAPAATAIALDPSVAQDFEALEGMLVTVTSGTADPLTVIENFNLDRFGEITISAGTQTQATQLFDAQTEAAEVAAVIEGNLNNRILLDDGSTSQNPDSYAYLPGGAGDNGNGFLDLGDDFGDAGTTLRLGTELTADVTGALGFGFGEFRLYANDVLQIDESTNSGARQATPDAVGGDLQLASFNVLNYFTTFSGSTLGGVGVRGADNQEELDRQTSKIVQAMEATGADVFALQEIENGGFAEGSAIDTLVDALNAQVNPGGTGPFAFVNPTGVTAPGDTGGLIGTDAIATGIIYDTTKVQLIHSEALVFEESSAAVTFALAEILNPFVPTGDQVGDFQRNRPSVAATFEELDALGNPTGNTFTVASSHFKSKGDSDLQDLVDAAQDFLDNGGTGFTQADIDNLIADPNFDQGDGQGFWNQVRADASSELAAWIETDYNGSGAGDNYVLLGDLNAYAEEDPVDALVDDAGLVDLIDTFVTGGQAEAYSFVFDGQQGSLDHGIASEGFADLVTGATEWHINADEPDLIGYDTDFNDPAFFNPGVYGASDHDPLIVGIDFDVVIS